MNRKSSQRKKDTITSKFDDIILKINHGKSGEITSNYYPWVDKWRSMIGSYGENFVQQFDERMIFDDTLADKLEPYQLQPELDVSLSAWVPSPEQRDELLLLVETPHQFGWRQSEMYQVWANDRRNQNIIIKNDNDMRANKRKEIISADHKHGDVVAGLITDIFGSMDRNTRELCESYKRDFNEGEVEQLIADGVASAVGSRYDAALARKNGDWLWPFTAAEAICITRQAAGVDGVTRAMRQQAERRKLEGLKHQCGFYTSWRKSFLNQLDTCASVGLQLSPIEKLIAFVACLNPEIFAIVIADWSSVARQNLLPQDFDSMLSYVDEEFTRVSATNPLLVSRVQNKSTKTESSFKATEEVKVSVARKCEICGNKHKTDDCKYRNNSFSVAANKSYFDRSKKRASSKKPADTTKEAAEETTSAPVQKGTYASPPVKNEKVNAVVEEALFCSVEESIFAARRIIPKQIDLVIDTASETQTVVPAVAGLLASKHRDNAVIRGVGGGVTHTSQAGFTIFGKARVVQIEGNRCLISLPCAEERWQLVHPRKGTLLLREWPDQHSRFSGRIWEFSRNPAKFGDELFHTLVTAEELIEFMDHAGVADEKAYSFYYPSTSPDVSTLPSADTERLRRVQNLHDIFNHASAQSLLRIIGTPAYEVVDDALRVTASDIHLWKEMMADHCEGCLVGKMKQHMHVRSTKREVHDVGTAGTGDLMFIELSNQNKSPLMIHVDFGSKAMIGVHLKSKDMNEINRGLDVIRGHYRSHNHELRLLTYDRESALAAAEDTVLEKGVQLQLKAAGQKSGLAEVSISHIRMQARATKAGVIADYRYTPPVQWNKDLASDTISVINCQVRPNYDKSPFELFTGKQPDLLRNFRARWGEPILAKKRRGLSSDLNSTALWAIVVRRIMNGTGVLKVFSLETRKYLHILKFARPRVPKRITDLLNELVITTKDISWEEGEERLGDIDDPEDDEPEPLLSPQEMAVLERFESGMPTTDVDRAVLDSVYYEGAQPDPVNLQEVDPDAYPNDDEHDVPVSLEPESRELTDLRNAWISPPARTKREVRVPQRLVYHSNILFERAVKLNPDAAFNALDKELNIIAKKKVWRGELMENLTAEERSLVLPNMKNYVEKFHPTGEFDKAKVRELQRGDLQSEVAETEGPVCRVETVFILFCIAVVHNYEVFKIDFVAAFLNTDMPDEVSHKWMLLDTVTSTRLLQHDYSYWQPFYRKDGKILVRLQKLIYGYKEAAHYWNKVLMAMFVKDGWVIQSKDKCLVRKTSEKGFALVAITVDDLTCIAPFQSGFKEALCALCRDTFEEITVEEGDTIKVIGMTFEINREDKSVKVSQKRFAEKAAQTYGVTKTAVTPYTSELFDRDPLSPLLSDQRSFMSINSTAMYGGKRTYPELLVSATFLAGFYGKATEEDYAKSLRMIEYLNYYPDHCLYLRPISLDVVACADASYAEHGDARSHTGGCVGFAGRDGVDAYIAYISSKQSLVAKSSCEAELIASNTTAEYVVWLKDLMNDLGLDRGVPVPFGQDNNSTMRIASQGHGTFKRTKHIKVRYFWIKDLIDQGILALHRVPTEEMAADLMTKATTGARFRYLLAKVLGWNGMPKKD